MCRPSGYCVLLYWSAVLANKRTHNGGQDVGRSDERTNVSANAQQHHK